MKIASFLLATGLVTVAISLAASCSPHSAPRPDPLLPMSTLLAPASYDAPQLSPDGTRIAYLGPLDGVMNLYVSPVDDLAAARPVTAKTGRGVAARDVSGNVLYRWTADSRRLIYPEDENGDENWNLIAVDVESGEERNLTGFSGAQAELLGNDPWVASPALIGIRGSLIAPPDLYRLDLETGERTLVQEAGGFIGFVADHALQPRIALAFDGDGGIALFGAARSAALRSASYADRWKPMFTVGPEDLPALSATGYQKISRFDAENRRSYFYDSRGRDTAALVAWDFETGELEVIAEDPRVDIGGVLFHPTEHRPQAYATEWTKREWHALDPAIAADLEHLSAATPGDFEVVSRSADDRRWIVRLTVAHEPEAYALYERPRGELRRLFVTTPQLEDLRLSKMYPVVVRSRDGLDLVSYLSYPPWLDGGDGKPSEPVPLILLVHGGPSDERARYAYGPFLHWLTNRGYGVFYVNYRGSAGFGKAFMNAQRMEWGGRMHDDLIDQVEWAIAEGITTRDRVAILGGSYGGYAVLVGMTMTPEVFACGIDLVGPSNLEIFMPHWNVDMMSRVLGDPRTEEGRAFLRSRSPIRFARQAVHPILIGQGAHDSRVPQDQSESLVKELETVGAPVTYVLYPDEGHGLARPENSMSFWAIAEVFLGGCLGGRYEELGDQLVGSSAEVRAGSARVKGLEAALARRSSVD